MTIPPLPDNFFPKKKKLKQSKWREERVASYGEAVLEELRAKFPDTNISIMELAKDNRLKCTAHLAPTTRYDILAAVCSWLADKGILNKSGRTYYFPKKAVA